MKHVTNTLILFLLIQCIMFMIGVNIKYIYLLSLSMIFTSRQKFIIYKNKTTLYLTRVLNTVSMFKNINITNKIFIA